MSHLLTLPTLLVLLAFPWFGKLPSFRLKRTEAVAPADTLPPPWKGASRLALENYLVRPALPSLVPGAGGLKLREDPRRLRVSVRPDSSTISAAPELGDVSLGPPARQALAEFARELSVANFQRGWRNSNRQKLNSLGQWTPTGPTPGSGLSLKFPSPLPRRVQSWLGPGGPALTVSGAENIRLSGQSNWTNQQTPGLLGRKQSLFPSLDMQQDLDIRLEGQLSDRIRVNLLQNTGIAIPLSNRIAINYKGDEDDLVQSLDLGNTNLTLPGTQYVSYSGRNEGLFGVKATTRVGPLDLTVLASKQEGRSERASYSGGGTTQRSPLYDADWVRGQYFFLYDPNGLSYYIPPDSVSVYFDDFNASNDYQNGVARARAYVNPVGAPLDTLGQFSVPGFFSLWNYGADLDYEILTNIYGPVFPVLRLTRPLTGNDHRLAVSYFRYPILDQEPSGRLVLGAREQVGGTYSEETPGDTTRTLNLQLIRAPQRSLQPDDPNRLNEAFFDSTSVFEPVRELELKNVYQLPGQQIDPGSFKISIRRGSDDPPNLTFQTAATGDTAISYLEAVGLDNFDESTGSLVQGHDGRVDGTLPAQQNRVFVDFENGTLWFYDLRPFQPRLWRRFEGALDRALFRRARLDGAPASANEANRVIYDRYTPRRDQDWRYRMDVEFSARRATGEISLGRTNLLEGSERVTVNGVDWVRDRDYTIDYDLGRLTLKKQLAPTENLSVNYSYAPLFQQAGRTLLGSAFRLEGRDKLLGGAFMYESKGAQDLRPRIGEEPSRSVIGDLNTDWTFRPGWVTRLVDNLPGVRTTAPSEFRVQAEVGASFPNPNTRNEVYVDDMEGVRDAVSLSMDRGRWHWASQPQVKSGSVPLPISSLPDRKMAEVHWYSPPSAVDERDLKPNLSDAQGAKNKRQVLALSVPRRPLSALPADTLWMGLNYVLDPTGIDLSRSQFIELWVNDFNDLHTAGFQPRVRGRHVRMHVDLGAVSEDQQRAPNRMPNGRLDTEDRGNPGDGQLSVTDENNEDTGYDGFDPDTSVFVAGAGFDPRNVDLVTAGAEDPAGDHFQPVLDTPNKEDIDPRRYVFVNGTEDNHTLDPQPDTEDVNGNGILDRDEDYFEYTIDLGDAAQRYLITDVQRDFPSDTFPSVKLDNGWRRYRIPINDSLRVAFGTPNLALARHVRVWFDGIVDGDPPPGADVAAVVKPLLMLGGLEIVGSRWQAVALTDSQSQVGTRLTLNAVNSVDNADVYTPPFDPGKTRTGSQELLRREQSIAMEFERLQPADTLEAFKTFSLDENYSRYGKLTWYVAGFDIPAYMPGSDPLWYFVRFASDEQGRNYYEVKSPVPPSSSRLAIQWRKVEVNLTDLSNLKLRPDFPVNGDLIYRSASVVAGDSVLIRGRPSFTRLRRISFGLINASGATVFPKGQLWFDEVRATDVAKDQGTAQRVLMTGKFANLASYNLTWDGRDADFITVGQSRGSGMSNQSLNFGGSLETHRFFEATGIVLPITYGYSRNTQTPRFTAGDDVVRTGALADASVTRTESRSFSTSYARTWSDRSNPFLRYTVGGLTGSYSRSQSEGTSPSGFSTSTNSNVAVNYGISPRNLLKIALPGTKTRLYLLPERFYWNYNSAKSEARNYSRSADGSNLRLQSAPKGRTATLAFGADTRPFDLLHHHFDALRNLALEEPLLEKVGGINFGHVVNWKQNLDANYQLNRGAWLNPRLSWNSSFNQDNRPELSPQRDFSVRAIGNAQSMSVNWSLPFDRLVAQLPKAPDRVVAPADTARVRAEAPATPARRPVFEWRRFLSRLGNVSTDASFNRNSSYSRLTGIPSLGYMLGLADDPGLASDSTGRMREEFGNVSSLGSDWRTSARTRLLLVYDASLNTQAEFTGRRSEQNGVVTRALSSRFPSFEVNYGRFTSLIPLKRFMTNPTLRTSYSRSISKDYRNSGDQPTGILTSSQWQPLLSLEGDLKNQTRMNVKVERRVTERESFQLGHSVRTERSTDLNLGLTRSYTKGQKVKFLNKETTVKSSVQLSLTAVYSRQSGETRQVNQPNRPPQNPQDRDRLSLNGNGRYSFSSNVTGSVLLGYGRNVDHQLNAVTQNVRVELSASFTF